MPHNKWYANEKKWYKNEIFRYVVNRMDLVSNFERMTPLDTAEFDLLFNFVF